MTNRFDPKNIRQMFNRGRANKVEEPELDSIASETTYEPHYVYDDNIREQVAPELARHGLFFPEDPNSPEFDDLIEKIKQIDLSTAIRVQQARTDMNITGDNPLMAESQKRAELGNKGREFFERYFMTTNASGNPVVNKTLLLGTAGAIAIAAFFLVGQPANKSSSSTASATQGTTIENADGSTVTTFPDGTVTTKRPDGTSETKKPDGTITVTTPDGVATTTYTDGRILKTFKDNSSEETLADGQVIRRDPAGNTFANLPPSELSSDLSTGSLIQKGKQTAIAPEQPTIDGAQTPTQVEESDTVTTDTVPTDTLSTTPDTTDTPPLQDTSTVSSALPPSEPVVEDPNTGEPYTPPASIPTASAESAPVEQNFDQGGSAPISEAAPPSTVVIADPPPTSPSASSAPNGGQSAEPYTTTVASPSDGPINVGSSTTGTPTTTTVTPGNSGINLGTQSGPDTPIALPPGSSAASDSGRRSTSSASTSSAPLTINPARQNSPTQRQAGVTQMQPGTSIQGGQARPSQGSTVTTTAPVTAAAPQGSTTTIMRSNGQTGGGAASSGSSAPNGGSAVLAYRSTTPQQTVVMRPTTNGTQGQSQGGAGGSSSTIYRRQPQGTEGQNTPQQTGYGTAQSYSTAQSQGPAPTPNIDSGDTGSPTSTNVNTPVPSGTLPSGVGDQGAAGNPGMPGMPGGEASLPASPYRNGQYVQARLETAVLMPVSDANAGQGQLTYARTTDGTLWLGTAVASATKRLEVHYTQAILPDGKEVAVNAYAYHTDGTLGIKGQYRDIAPTLANDLIRSALTGVRNYAEAKLQATTTTTLPNGTTTVSRTVPTIWESVAGSATGVFQLPATQNTFVTVVQAPVGTQFVIVNMPAPKRQ